jgi:hypothetical protein
LFTFFSFSMIDQGAHNGMQLFYNIVKNFIV